MRTSIGFALGTLFSLGVMSANAAGTSVAAPTKALAQTVVEVLVVTAKRPTVAETIEAIIVTAKRPSASSVTVERSPPAMAVERPKLELALDDRLAFRL